MKKQFTKSASALTLSTLLLAGCASLTPPKQIQARVIETTRNNITTTPKVSNLSNSILLASGLTQDSCMADFDACLNDLGSAFFGDQFDREGLVLLAELHYTQALHLAEKMECKPTLNRPPIDDYYANAPIDEETRQAQIKSRKDCLEGYRDALYKTIAFSYGYLFFDSLTNQNSQKPIITDSDIRAQDLYHVSVNALIQEVYKQQDGAFGDADQQTKNQLNSAFNQINISSLITQSRDGGTQTLNLNIAKEHQELHDLQNSKVGALSDLISIYDYRLADLQVNSTRSGLGVGFVGSLQDRYSAPTLSTLTANADANNDDIKSRIHPMGHLLLTAIITPKGNTLKEVLLADEFDAYFFDPYTTKEVNILGKSYPLSASFSSTYATWLSENNLQRTSLLNMIAKKDSATMPELFMLSPYNPNQKVIIMIHGLASSPTTWVNLTNNLLADPILRDNYQVWQVFYATNLPILENRYQIHKLINQSFNSTDPTGANPASQNAILIGHSMGGVISRMLLSDDELLPKLSTLEDREPSGSEIIEDTVKAATATDESAMSHEQNLAASRLLTKAYNNELSERFTLRSLPQIGTAVFISAPFRGTDYADRWFTRAARRVIRLPLNLTKSVTETITNIGVEDNIENNLLGLLYLQNGADQLSDRSAFVELTADINIKDGVRYHTIVGDHQGLASNDGSAVRTGDLSDGIVPYTSSHLENSNSETIITGRHNIHENPKTILQLRKILHEEINTPRPNANKPATPKDSLVPAEQNSSDLEELEIPKESERLEVLDESESLNSLEDLEFSKEAVEPLQDSLTIE